MFDPNAKAYQKCINRGSSLVLEVSGYTGTGGCSMLNDHVLLAGPKCYRLKGDSTARGVGAFQLADSVLPDVREGMLTQARMGKRPSLTDEAMGRVGTASGDLSAVGDTDSPRSHGDSTDAPSSLSSASSPTSAPTQALSDRTRQSTSKHAAERASSDPPGASTTSQSKAARSEDPRRDPNRNLHD